MVEICSIGSLLERKRTKAKDQYSNAPVYAVTNNRGFVLSSSLHDFDIFSDDTSNYMVVSKNDFAYNPSRLNVGSIAYFKEEGNGLISPMYVVFHADENKILAEYLYIVIKSEFVRNKIDALKEVGARFRFDFNRWDLIKIPIPSLEEQARIVGILDTFTSSIDNLKEQIAQRRKQYEYYRNQLLDLEGKPGVEMKIIKEVFDTRNGYTPSTSNETFWNDGIIPWFKMEDIRDNGRILSDSYLHITPQAVKGKGLFKANSIILATSATIGEHALILVDFLSNQRFTNIALKEKYAKEVDMKYIYYYMFIIDEWCKQHVNQGGFASVDMTGLYNLPIPLPPFQEQQRIVSILDTFEASISNLEAQLKERQKQYEYYRNKLLTF